MTKDREPCLEGEAGTPSADLYTALPCRRRSKAAERVAYSRGSSEESILTDSYRFASSYSVCLCVWRYGTSVEVIKDALKVDKRTVSLEIPHKSINFLLYLENKFLKLLPC